MPIEFADGVDTVTMLKPFTRYSTVLYCMVREEKESRDLSTIEYLMFSGPKDLRKADNCDRDTRHS